MNLSFAIWLYGYMTSLGHNPLLQSSLAGLQTFPNLSGFQDFFGSSGFGESATWPMFAAMSWSDIWLIGTWSPGWHHSLPLSERLTQASCGSVRTREGERGGTGGPLASEGGTLTISATFILLKPSTRTAQGLT